MSDQVGNPNCRFSRAKAQINMYKLKAFALAVLHEMSRIVRKTDFCLCENKGADQLRGNREADLRLCFRIGKNPVFSRRGSDIFH